MSPPTVDDDSIFKTTKKDKQRIKHSLLLSMAQSSSDKPSGIRKRRRPSKKLATSLDALADALPDIVAAGKDGNPSTANERKLTSLQSKPGARKKRDKLDREERDRFGKNLAILSQARSAEEKVPASIAVMTEASAAAPVNRWAALRQHITSSFSVTSAGEKG